MSTDVQNTVQEDAQAVADALAAGIPLDPALTRRIHERAEQARQMLLQTRGVQDVAVQLIREIRGDLVDQ